MIGIIDYGMGNIHSVAKALEHMGAKAVITNKITDLALCEKIVLPGVGAFADAVKELQRQNLIAAIKDFIKNKKIFLGICLGMQLLFEKSAEAKTTAGLGIFKGEVKRFPPKTGFKIPHMGWNQLKIKSKECRLLKKIPDNSYVYFCHSYYSQPRDKKIVAASCDYIRDFTAVAWKDNVYGVQFHPEKSQDTGLLMLKNFVEL